MENVATIAPVPEPYRSRVRTPSYALKVNLIALTPLIFFAGGFGLVALGVYAITEEDLIAGYLPIIVGVAAFGWGSYTGLCCLCVYENRWIERKLRSTIAQRPDLLIDPAAADAVYVSIIPRENWSKIKWTMSSDLLLMRIDERRREILLEGDLDRYRIPAEAIVDCAPECFFHPVDLHRNELWMLRLVIFFDAGKRELLLSIPHTSWRPHTNASRRTMVRAACRAINALRPPAPVCEDV